jgi:hypothetical protein
MTGNNIASDTLEAFFKYFFNVPENEEVQQYLSATNYDSHYKFHDGELFFIDKGSSSYDRMLLGFYAQDCENFADAIKELFTGKTPKPIYIIITTGSASSTIASAGHFTSGKISKVGDNVILECTNSLGKSTGTIESFYGHMKTAYEKGTIDTIIAKETEKRNAISFDANIWETLSSKFTAEQMQWDYLKTELENFEKTCIDYYNHEITYAQHEGTTTLRRKQKNEVESTHKVLFHATNKEFDTFFFDIMTNNSLSIRDNIIKYATYLKQRNINNEKDYQTILSSLTKFKSSKEIVSIIPFNIGNGTFQKLRLEKKDTLLSIEFIDNELAEPQTLLQNLCYKALLVNAYNQIN